MNVEKRNKIDFDGNRGLSLVVMTIRENVPQICDSLG